MSKNISKLFNTIFPFADFLYLLQLEEYETGRYFRRLRHFYFKRHLQRRDRLVYTFRTKIILLLTLPLGVITPFLIPIWVGLGNILITPLFSLVKYYLIHKAANYFNKTNSQTKVIAIAGSYGKTTVKNYLYEMIKYHYKTQMLPGNINTSVGIAKWVLSEYDPYTQILIVEVDTYRRGEITQSLLITPPDISILTNVGDQHLERFKNSLELKIALKEVLISNKPNFIKISDKKSNLDYALATAHYLKIPPGFVKDTIKKLSPPDRRGNITQINGYSVIDASYNISETTAEATLVNARQLARKRHQQLIAITAGIPELGQENINGNHNLGKYLAEFTDQIVLLKSIFYPEIISGIGKSNVITASSLPEAWEKLDCFNKQKFLVLLLPELTDLYYPN